MMEQWEYENKIKKAISICNKLKPGLFKSRHISRLFKKLNQVRTEHKRLSKEKTRTVYVPVGNKLLTFKFYCESIAAYREQKESSYASYR